MINNITQQEMHIRCYVCNRKLGKNPNRADTHEDQWVFVGSECWKHIKKAGKNGITLEGCTVKLYPLTSERIRYFEQKGYW